MTDDRRQSRNWRSVPWVRIAISPWPWLFLLAAAGCYAYYSDGLKVGPPDYCPRGTWPQKIQGIQVPGHTPILIDTSNRISNEDRELAFLGIRNWARRAAPVFQRVSIWGLRDSVDETVEPRGGSWCVPKRGADANQFYEQEDFVEAEFQRFLAGTEIILRELLDRDEAGVSPIVEAMAELVERYEHTDSVVDSFVIVSDMLQNTPAWSHYSAAADTANVQDSARIQAACRRITASGQVKSVHVYYINRSLPEIQPLRWPSPWWRECLKGVELLMM